MFMFFLVIFGGQMILRKNLIYQLLLLTVAFSSVAICDELFSLKLTTESLKTKENTQYSYHYFVKDDKTGDYKTQKETKEGDSVYGSYSLAEPNGDLRTVTYTAGPGTGFQAKVDVQPNMSPMKPTTVSQGTVNSILQTAKTEKPTTLGSNVSRSPVISNKPQFDVKTEMEMQFPLKANSVTEPATDSTKPLTIVESNPTKKPSEDTEIKHAGFTTDNLEGHAIENGTFLTEGREISEDPIEKEIDEAINSMPKLPEFILSDNKTHFKFHKDPEEALLDERITQIARQLAETSLKREYEERKLGHYIPISLASIEPSTRSYLTKSYKFMRKDTAPTLQPSEPPSLHVFTQVRLVPQYIYRYTLSPGISQRFPIVSKQTQKPEEWEQQTYEAITTTPDIIKINKSETHKTPKVKEKKFSANHETTYKEPTSVMPEHVPKFLQFFTPSRSEIQEPDSYAPQKKSPMQYVTATIKKYLAKEKTPKFSYTTPYAPVTVATENTNKFLNSRFI